MLLVVGGEVAIASRSGVFFDEELIATHTDTTGRVSRRLVVGVNRNRHIWGPGFNEEITTTL